jgi:hypothetical protein
MLHRSMYAVELTWTNNAGTASTFRSRTVLVDETPPVMGVVVDLDFLEPQQGDWIFWQAAALRRTQQCLALGLSDSALVQCEAQVSAGLSGTYIDDTQAWEAAQDFSQPGWDLDLLAYQSQPNRTIFWVNGMTTANLTLKVVWAMADSDSHIAGIQMAVGTCAGCADMLPWTNVDASVKDQ